MKIVLASSSPSRRAQLKTLQIPFQAFAPSIDESRMLGETPKEMVKRLSIDKAYAVSSLGADTLIIGSDQIAVLGDEVLGKPHTVETAAAYLRKQSGCMVNYLTGVALYHPASDVMRYRLVRTQASFRSLTDAQIDAYIARDNPLLCAGALRVESLGITLLHSISSADRSAIIGLPLIALTSLLQQAGVTLPLPVA